MNKAFPDDEDGSLWKSVVENAAQTGSVEQRWVSQSETKEAQVKIHICPACAAELLTDSETQASGTCAYCGNPVTISDRLLSADNLPSRLIPFKITREQAFGIFHEKTKRKPLMPSEFKAKCKPGLFNSVYVPFMLYDAGCSANITARCENITTWSDSDYDYTKTDTYEARRSGSMDFSGVPVDASDKIDDEGMQAVEPFDLNEITPFSLKYLSGHMAEAPTTKDEALTDTLNGRLKSASERSLLDTVWGYDRVSLSDSSVAVNSVTSEYVMFPVWTLSAKYKQRDYIYSVNGQTGKFEGKFPVDLKSAGLLFLKIALAVFGAVFIGLEVFLWLS
jgi:hypothetical protein